LVALHDYEVRKLANS